jgi:hypothetical protein
MAQLGHKSPQMAAHSPSVQAEEVGTISRRENRKSKDCSRLTRIALSSKPENETGLDQWQPH